jgi:hypothetical protein
MNMRRNLRPLAAFAMVALISLISAGCGSDAPSETGTASSSGTAGSAGGGTSSASSSSSGSGTSSASSPRQKAVRFAECMRNNGVREFPDPDASGGLTIDGVLNGSSLDPSTAAWKEAMGACRDLQPPGFTGHTRSAQEQESALEFAQCMRDNGVEDFPDPTRDGPLIDTNRIPSAAGRGARSIPGFDAAAQKCGAAFAGELGLRSP